MYLLDKSTLLSELNALKFSEFSKLFYFSSVCANAA